MGSDDDPIVADLRKLLGRFLDVEVALENCKTLLGLVSDVFIPADRPNFEKAMKLKKVLTDLADQHFRRLLAVSKEPNRQTYPRSVLAACALIGIVTEPWEKSGTHKAPSAMQMPSQQNKGDRKSIAATWFGGSDRRLPADEDLLKTLRNALLSYIEKSIVGVEDVFYDPRIAAQAPPIMNGQERSNGSDWVSNFNARHDHYGDFGIRAAVRGTWTIVTMHGQFDVYMVTALRSALLELYGTSRHLQLVLELDCTFFDSPTLGVLIGHKRRSFESGAVIRMVCNRQRIVHMFLMTGLYPLYSWFPSVEAAASAPVRDIEYMMRPQWSREEWADYQRLWMEHFGRFLDFMGYPEYPFEEPTSG